MPLVCYNHVNVIKWAVGPSQLVTTIVPLERERSLPRTEATTTCEAAGLRHL